MGLDAVELIMAAEERFGIEISDTDAEQIRTFGDFVDLIVRYQSGDKLFTKELEEPTHSWLSSPKPSRRLLKPKDPFTREQIANELRQIVVEQLGVNPSDVTDEARFIEDLGMD